MELSTAIALVVADQREGHPDFEPMEAVSHARNTIRIGEVAHPGAYPLGEDDGSELWVAYRAVLSATDDEIAEALS